MEQGMPDQMRPTTKRLRPGHESSLGRPPRSGAGGPEGRVVRQRLAHPSLEPPPKEAASGEVQRIVFNSDSPTIE